MNEFVENLTVNLKLLSEVYGTGILPLDLAALFGALGVGFLVLLFLLLIFRSGPKKHILQSIELSKGLHGKIEKLEKQLNDSRTEALRKIEFLTQRVEKLEGKKEGGEGEKKGEEEGKEKGKEEGGEKDEESFFLRSEQEKLDETGNAFVEQETESLQRRLGKSRRGFFQRVKDIFRRSPQLGPQEIEELESQLIATDIGVQMTQSIISGIQTDLERGEQITQEILSAKLQEKVLSVLGEGENLPIRAEKLGERPKIILLVGVNGVGKTTTAAKLARKWKEEGVKLLLVAADTFRAAAVEQLKTWGARLDVPVVFGPENAKPATVVFDALERAKQEPFDCILIDTAGRLHTKANLMQEIEGLRNIIERHYGVGPDEVLLVLDGSTGQNALSQAKEFHDVLNLTGLIVTKLDGSAKGGIVVAIHEQLGLPIRYIGVGEGEHDLRDFKAKEFVQALFDDEGLDDVPEVSINAARRRIRRESAGLASI